MEYFGTTVFLISLFVLNSVMAFVFLSYVPTENDRCNTYSIRYFQSYFILASLGYLSYVGRPWMPFELSIFMTNLFLLSSGYSVVLGILWRYKFHRHFYSLPILLHIVLHVLSQLALSLYFPEEELYRLVLIYINLSGVLLYALSLFGRFKSDNNATDSLLRLAVIFAVVNVLSIPVFYFGAENPILFMNILLLTQNLVVFFMFGTVMYTALFDSICSYKLSVSIEPTTGLYNRRFFIEQAHRFLHAAERHEFPMSLVICDIDRFTLLVDELGYFVGEHAVLSVANVVKQETREEDLIAHLGQKEFVVLLPQTRLNGALLIAERMRAEIESLPLQHEQHQYNLTVSLCVTSIEHHSDINLILAEADKALKRAKKSSHNQVIQVG